VQAVIGGGEEWITELSTDELRDMVALRSDPIGVRNGAAGMRK
jgi:hypothetical protein